MVEQIPLIVWDDHKAMGVARLDEEHHGIVERFNQLVKAASLNDAAAVELGLDALAGNAAAHFSLEESYIRSARSRLSSRHLLLHDMLLEHLERIRLSYFMGDLDGRLPDVLWTLGNDLSFHLFRDDLDISRALGITPGQVIS